MVDSRAQSMENKQDICHSGEREIEIRLEGSIKTMYADQCTGANVLGKQPQHQILQPLTKLTTDLARADITSPNSFCAYKHICLTQ